MARPKKIGLEYFPLDCDFDDKIAMLEVECGNDGCWAWIRILQHVYKTEIGELNISDVIRRKTYAKQANMSVETWNNYIETMVNVGLFDAKRYKKDQVLTSNGIQERIKKVSSVRAAAIERAKKRVDNQDNTNLEISYSPNNSADNERISTESKSKSESKMYLENTQEGSDIFLADDFFREKLETEFEWFWPTYDKNRGKENVRFQFKKLTDSELDKIRDHLPKYVASTDKEYRADPFRYITEKMFNDEIINRKNGTTNQQPGKPDNRYQSNYKSGEGL